MKFIVSSSALLKELQTLGGVINATNTLPILDNVLFQLNENKLSLTASDLETTLSTVIAVESTDTGQVALPARLLTDMLKTFLSNRLRSLKPTKTPLRLALITGNMHWLMLKQKNFPRHPPARPSKTELQGDVLATAINATLFASGNDDLRPVMSGVFFQFSTDALTFVATDAHKLVKYTRTDLTAAQSAEFIMPKNPYRF